MVGLQRRLCTVALVLCAQLGVLGCTHIAHAQPYPDKAIRIIVPFAPGGSAATLARAYGAWFSDKFGVPVIAHNRPGAGTEIAHSLGTQAAPEGYTLLLGSSSGLTTNPAFGTKLNYDPIKDFAPAGSTPQQLSAWVRSEIARWTKVARDAGIQAQGTEAR
jgi:tripartite-type tricarboxylate transporter receptor subunit TctC